jgi:hypothetical protein
VVSASSLATQKEVPDVNIRNDGQIHMHAINLEGCTDSELQQVQDHPTVHCDVRQMAALYLTARQLRLQGEIAQAMRIEAKTDALYDTLPAALRW